MGMSGVQILGIGRMRGKSGWSEIPLGVVFNVRRQHRCCDVRPHAACQQSVSVRLSVGRSGATDCAPATSNILYHHCMCQTFRHLLSNDPGQTSCAWEWNNYGDGFDWIILRLGGEWNSDQTTNRELKP